MGAIVLIVGIAAFLIFQSVKFNDNPFFREAIVIFYTQEMKLVILVPKFYFFV